MNAEGSHSDENEGSAADVLDESVFIRTLEHAKVAYANAQDVIKFVDLKSNVLIALSTVVSGFALSLAKWNFELPPTSPGRVNILMVQHPGFLWAVIVLFGLSLFSTALSFGAATWTMIVRPAAKTAFTVLYPVPRKNQKETHRRLVMEKLSGMSREAILQEFTDQLFAVGQILQAKQRASRIGAITVIAQLVLLTAAIFIYVCLVARS